MQYRVELRRAAVDGGARLHEATLARAIDAIDAACYARAQIALLYDEPESFWIVEAVIPLAD
jgi:hypothetical protein